MKAKEERMLLARAELQRWARTTGVLDRGSCRNTNDVMFEWF
jgi:hypothetical protein